ncbi:MAG: dihydroanticapsin 7-dehydrogenase [Alphaproteobacteria bacterium]|nr:MAG: dihydroanticapsin 7-dehydrogenase [Alphaproteobacteria bacterium]
MSATSGRPRLEGRRIVITGAASGVGAATVELFLREGAKVAGLDLDPGGRRTDALSSLALDVADHGAVDRAIGDAAHRMGGIDGVVNAAGIIALKPFIEMDAPEIRRLLDVNLIGPINVCRAALPFMCAAGQATIVNVSSGAGLLPLANCAAYAASKGGLNALTKALAVEYAPSIRVNAVAPGLIDTPMTRNRLGGEIPAGMAEAYPLKRTASPAEIADVILFLTGPESSYVTGATLAADGGRTLH